MIAIEEFRVTKDEEVAVIVNGKELTKKEMRAIEHLINEDREYIDRNKIVKQKILEVFQLFMWNIPSQNSEDEKVQKLFAEEVFDILKKHFHRCEKCGRSKAEAVNNSASV